MGKFAPVCPVTIAAELRAWNNLGEYHLLLAHDVAANTSQYSTVYAHDRWVQGTIIMDNSIIELGDAVDLKMIKLAADTVQANVVVLPDVLLDGQGTVDRITEALPIWRDAFDIGKMSSLDKLRFMFVPQGNTREEWIRCAQQLARVASNFDSGWWGIPRNYNQVLGLSRREACEIAYMLQPSWPIHLLGFSNDLADDFLCARLPFVRGIDSAVPLRLGDDSNPRPIELEMEIEPRGDWWDYATFNNQMITNMRQVSDWVKTPSYLR